MTNNAAGPYWSVSIIGSKSKIILQSFNSRSQKKIPRLEPGIPLIQLYRYNEEAKLTARELHSLEKYAARMGVNFDMVDEEYIKKAHSHGIAIHLFTVNTDEGIQRAVEIEADGVFTDYS